MTYYFILVLNIKVDSIYENTLRFRLIIFFGIFLFLSYALVKSVLKLTR